MAEPQVIYDEEPNIVYDDAPEAVPGPVGRGVPSGMVQAAQDIAREREERSQRKLDEMTSVLGGNYDPYATFDEGFLTQFDIARSETLVDKQRKFKLAFPDGDMKAVPTADGKILVARLNRDALYQELPLSPEILATVFSEPMVGGVVGSFFGPVGTIAGVTAGEYGQTKVEQERGFGTNEPGFLESLQRGGIAGAIDAATRGVTRMIYGPRLTSYAREAMHKSIIASRELGLEPLAVGQLSGPFGRGVFRQVGATSSRVEEKVTAEEKSLLDSFRKIATDEMPATADLDKVIQAQQNELRGLINFPVLSRVDSGEALQLGIETYKNASRLRVGQLYDEAIALSDDVVFNLRPAKEIAGDIARGVLGRSETGDVVNLASVPGGELKAVVDDILALEQNVAKVSAQGGEWTAFEQIKTLRTRLFDLKQSDDGAVRRAAGRLWESMTEVMDNPVSGNPDFVAAYQKAGAANWMREDTLEKSFVAQALKSDTPEALARKYMNPNNATALATIKDILIKDAPQQWEQFRSGFMADLMNAPTANQAITRLRNFESVDPDGLAVLMSPSERRSMAEYLTTKAQFEASPARKIIQQQLTEGERAVTIAKEGTAGELADAIAKSGGIESSFAKTARAGVYKDILDQAKIVNEQGIEVLDSGKLVQAINDWRKGDKLAALFRPADWRRIELFQKYSAVTSETADIGGAMMAGGLRQEFISAPMQTLWGDVRRVAVKVVKPLWQNEIAAIILSRPAAYSTLAMAQTGRVPIQRAGLALGMLQTELMREDSARTSGGTPGGDSPFVSPNP